MKPHPVCRWLTAGDVAPDGTVTVRLTMHWNIDGKVAV
jgi:hypothetical protein